MRLGATRPPSPTSTPSRSAGWRRLSPLSPHQVEDSLYARPRRGRAAYLLGVLAALGGVAGSRFCTPCRRPRRAEGVAAAARHQSSAETPARIRARSRRSRGCQLAVRRAINQSGTGPEGRKVGYGCGARRDRGLCLCPGRATLGGCTEPSPSQRRRLPREALVLLLLRRGCAVRAVPSFAERTDRAGDTLGSDRAVPSPLPLIAALQRTRWLRLT